MRPAMNNAWGAPFVAGMSTEPGCVKSTVPGGDAPPSTQPRAVQGRPVVTSLTRTAKLKPELQSPEAAMMPDCGGAEAWPPAPGPDVLEPHWAEKAAKRGLEELCMLPNAVMNDCPPAPGRQICVWGGMLPARDSHRLHDATTTTATKHASFRVSRSCEPWGSLRWGSTDALLLT